MTDIEETNQEKIQRYGEQNDAADEDAISERTGQDEEEKRESVEEITKQIIEATQKIEQDINNRIAEQNTLIEQRIDAQEELVANLMMAYAELASSLEATIEELMSPRSEKDKEEFRNDLNKRHAQMLQMIKEVADEVENSSKSNPGNSILNMAARKYANTPDSERSDAAGGEGEGYTTGDIA